jgi:hypothetical protein
MDGCYVQRYRLIPTVFNACGFGVIGGTARAGATASVDDACPDKTSNSGLLAQIIDMLRRVAYRTSMRCSWRFLSLVNAAIRWITASGTYR